MEAWQERVVEEKQELSRKIKKLQEFLRSEQYDKLSALEQDLLLKQSVVMMSYEDILWKRICQF